jgi:GNAT superfamily N-acetyltransferase
MTDVFELRRGDYLLSTDPSRIDVGLVHSWLVETYWARGIPREIVRRSIEGSIPFGVYRDGEMIGFARAVTDRATFAYVADVCVTEAERGKGLARLLLEGMLAHPDLQGLRRWMLGTLDAHGLYERLGFQRVVAPEMWMEIHTPHVTPEGAL